MILEKERVGANDLLIKQQQPFKFGYTAITKIAEAKDDTGINFGILKMRAGEQKESKSDLETAYLLMQGSIKFDYDGNTYHAERHSLFDKPPTAIHLAANQTVTITAETDAELSVQQVENDQSFETIVFDANNMLENEDRGKGLLGDTSYRIVRTIFDIRNRPQAKLVLGEVVNFPGCWSSYPPHHHLQPELYHYRFTEAQGYGHGESGDHVFKVQQYDTLKILYELDHAQCAAPGYGMYYIWVIRHLPGDPYTVPEFTEQHDWARSKEANKRVWSL